jgi:RNA polymerase sigma factor (sigma-70 family)
MAEHHWLAERFEEQRPHLRAVAFRMLASASEADDAVQDAWLRVSCADASGVENLGGWLTTVVARVCLNMLRARRTWREVPFGPHVPDPIVSPESGVQPEHEALLADSVGLALLVVLEALPPAERLAFVRHDMFGVPFDEIAPIVDRSPTAARQLASRAPPRAASAHGSRCDVRVEHGHEGLQVALAARDRSPRSRCVARARWRRGRSRSRASRRSCARHW